MTICNSIRSMCKTDLKRAEKKKKKAVSMLGGEVWQLYQAKVFKSVFEQESVKGVISEIEVHEKEIQDIQTRISEKQKEKEVRAALKKAGTDLKSEDVNVRKAAVRVLVKIGGKQAIVYLNSALKDSDADVRQKAAGALHKLVDSSLNKLQIPPLEEQKDNEK